MAEGADPQVDLAETGEDVTEDSSASEAQASTEDSSAQPEAKEPKGVQKRINELTANWREEQRRANSLQDQNFELQRQVLKPEAPKEVEQKSGEPKLDDYSSYEEYVDARADHRADLKIEAYKTEQSQQTQTDERAVRQEEFMTRAAVFRESHDDFDSVAFNRNLPVTQDMVDLLNVSDKGPELLYHLGQNPNEAARLSQLPTGQAAMELGRIEAQLGVLQPNTQTGAPDVIEPIDGGTGVSQSTDPDKMSTEEWLTWRQTQLKGS
ncbi:MAG: hypothetical protein V3V85_03055 [Candidatus Thorarchaeota archaeon]